MSPLRSTLVALLVASTALFAAGAIAERSSADTRAEPAAAHAEETGGEGGEPAGAHSEGEASGPTATGHDEGERLLGVDVESTPLVGLAAAAISGRLVTQPPATH